MKMTSQEITLIIAILGVLHGPLTPVLISLLKQFRRKHAKPAQK